MNVFEIQQSFVENLEPIQRLSRDIKGSAKILTFTEARFLVDAYYIMQDNRIRNGGQIRALSELGEPNSVLAWLFAQNHTLEKQVARALDTYSGAHPVGQWMRLNAGVGPVISAGFLAHLDVTRVNSAGGFWKFAGLTPDVIWEKGKKRPWNAELKTLCWKLGESFVKVSGKEEAYYGQEYLQKKAYYQQQNEEGAYRERAEELATKFNKSTSSYGFYAGKHGSPKLPPGHIHAMAKRHAVKMFLSHLFEIMYVTHYGKRPPEIYAVARLGHKNYIPPPFLDAYMEMLSGEIIDMRHPAPVKPEGEEKRNEG